MCKFIIRIFFSKRWVKFFIGISVLFLFLVAINNVYTQPPPPPPPPPTIGPYLYSAHGSITYGVNRSSLSTFGYSMGNCAHCHEQHASIGGAEPVPNSPAGPDYYLLFKDLWVDPTQSNIFCFGCHTDISSVQYSFSRTNYSYSYWAGGDTTVTCPDSIYESFQFVTDTGAPQTNCGLSVAVGSSHMLRDIRDYLSTRSDWNFPSTTNNINPCSGCHNPHRAKRDPHTTAGRTDGSGNLIVSAVSRPSRHSTNNNNNWDLWGDDPGERMSDYISLNGGTYQALYRYNSTSTYEPDGSSTTNGSNLFDTVNFCISCHATRLTSTRLGRRTYAINWSSSGDQHGGNWDAGGGGRKSPYGSASINYVLSCLDCHEPHGSPNAFLLRQEVNGVQVNVLNG